MERFGASFLISGVITFLLGFFLQGIMPVLTLRKLPIESVEQVAQRVPAEFSQQLRFMGSGGKQPPDSNFFIVPTRAPGTP